MNRPAIMKAALDLRWAAEFYHRTIKSKGDIDGHLAKAATDARESADALMAILKGQPPTQLQVAMKDYKPASVGTHA